VPAGGEAMAMVAAVGGVATQKLLTAAPQVVAAPVPEQLEAAMPRAFRSLLDGLLVLWQVEQEKPDA
jgi:hypothetical protein